jgi:hypothetical protein
MLHHARLPDHSTLALAPRAQSLPSQHSFPTRFPTWFPGVPNPSTSPRGTEEEETRFSQLPLCCFALLSLLFAPLHLPFSSSLLSPLSRTHSHLNNIHRKPPSTSLLRSRYSGVRFFSLCAAVCVTLLGRFFRGLKGRDPWRLILFFRFPCASFSWSLWFSLSLKSCR